jgi:hypothetical protein
METGFSFSLMQQLLVIAQLIIPPMSLEYDCCGSIDKNFKLDELRLRSVAGSLDDLKIASHKVEDVEKLILEEEWKVKHSTLDSHLSFLSYVGMATTVLTLICLCYCCCSKCCRKRCPKCSKWWKDNNPSTTVFKPKILLRFIHLEKVLGVEIPGLMPESDGPKLKLQKPLSWSV